MAVVALPAARRKLADAISFGGGGLDSLSRSIDGLGSDYPSRRICSLVGIGFCQEDFYLSLLFVCFIGQLPRAAN